MKKLLPFLVVACCFFWQQELTAQERYQDEIFSEVTVTADVTYGTNISILPALTGGEPGPEDMRMDVYEPAGDNLAERPVVIITHRGDFLPAVVNQQPYGFKGDFAVAELCKSLARRGFIAVGMNHRIGWNPFGSSIEKKSTILQASYRAAQDLRTCVRYFRKSAAEDGNPHRVDPARIAVGGYDSAGFAAFSAANLKTGSQTFLPKFLDLSTMPATPFVDTLIYGNPYGTDATPLNLPNYPEYSSDISAVISMQGGLGDFDWIEAGDPPVIGFQYINSFNAPGIRDVTEGTTSEILIPDGAFLDTIVHRNIELGNQDVFINANLNDPITQIAMERSGGMEGIFIYRPAQIEGSVQCDDTPGVGANAWGGNTYPWNAYSPENFTAVWNFVTDQTVPADLFMCQYNTSEGNPNDAAMALTYIDTMSRYIAPRLVLAMGLGETTSVDNTLKPELGFEAFPNPATTTFTLQAAADIQAVELFDISGKLVLQNTAIKQMQYQLNVQQLPKGMYFAKIRFERGIISEKLVVE